MVVVVGVLCPLPSPIRPRPSSPERGGRRQFGDGCGGLVWRWRRIQLNGHHQQKKKKRKLKPHCRRHHHLPINPPTHPSIIIISVGLGLFLPVIISFFDLVLGCPSCGSAAPFSAQRFYLLSTRLIFFFSGCWGGGGAICFGVARQSKYTLVHPCTANVFRVWASHQPRMRWC